MCMREDEVQELVKHFGNGVDEVSKELEEYVDKVVLLKSRYVFTWKDKKQEYGFFTCCKNTMRTLGLPHKSNVRCPWCKEEVKVIKERYKSKYLIDDGRFIWYEKSKVDPTVLVARAIYTQRDYRYDHTNVKTTYSTHAAYIFKIGNPIMLRRAWHGELYVDKFAGPDYDSGIFTNHNYKESLDNKYNAIASTELKYFKYWEWSNTIRVSSVDTLRLLNLYCRYPLIESLIKMGFGDAIESKMYSGRTYSAINWNGKTVWQMLRINGNDYKKLKGHRNKISIEFLAAYQLAQKHNSKKSIEKIEEVGQECELNRLKKILKYTSFDRAVTYIDKQLKKKTGILRSFYSANSVLLTWIDYIKDCKVLGMDLKEDSVIRPKNLYEQHQNTIKQIKVKEDREITEKIQNRAEKLNEYIYENDTYITRPIYSSKELIEEGKVLEHCVASHYSKVYANGETNIFAIRKKSEPDKPFVTMEWYGKRVIQVRKYKNLDPPEDVMEFVEEFKKEILEKNNKKKNNKKVA